jgi:hypothetical protein
MLMVPNRARMSIEAKRMIPARSPFTSRWPAAQIATPQRKGWRVMRNMPRITSRLSSLASWRTLVGLGVVNPTTTKRKAMSWRTS